MTKYLVSLVVLVSMMSNPAFGQTKSPVEKLAFYADVMVNASEPIHRAQANDTLLEAFRTLLKDNYQPVQLPGDQWVSSLTSPDSSFRIYTWQLRMEEDAVKYFGFIQTLDSTASWSVIELEDTRPFANASEYSEFTADTWYGALYYGLKAFTLSNGTQAYLISGFHANDRSTNLKIADILIIDSGIARFGYPVFQPREEDEKKMTSRVIVEYSDVSTVRLRYDEELKMLVFDHVIPYVAPSSPEGPVLISDGSYEAFKLNEVTGTWEYVSKVFDHVEEEAPRPFPILDERKTKDIFGRDKN